MRYIPSCFSPQLPPILMPKYPEYQPLFQSDNSIGSLLWPYMMSSCLTELMGSPFPSRMNGLPPCRKICYLLEHRSPPCKDERRRIRTHNSQYTISFKLHHDHSWNRVEPLPVVSDFAGLNTACTVDDLHQRSSSSASNYLLRVLQTLISTAREIHLSKTSCRRSSSSILYRLSLCRVLESLSVLHENEVLPPYLCLSTQPSELSSSICVSRHNSLR